MPELSLLYDIIPKLLPLESMQMRFMQQALVGLVLLAPMVALMGVQVVNFRMAFFADAISHSAFTGVAAVGSGAGWLLASRPLSDAAAVDDGVLDRVGGLADGALLDSVERLDPGDHARRLGGLGNAEPGLVHGVGERGAGRALRPDPGRHDLRREQPRHGGRRHVRDAGLCPGRQARLRAGRSAHRCSGRKQYAGRAAGGDR